MIDFNSSELKSITRKLNRLPDKVAKKHLRKGTNEGAKVIRNEAKMLAPVRTGRLKKNIITSKKKGDTRFSVTYGISGRSKGGRGNKNNAFYWRFVEFGTSRMPAQPFLRPAFDASKAKAAKAVGAYFKKHIVNEANRT